MKNVLRAIKFNQEPWSKTYVDSCIQFGGIESFPPWDYFDLRGLKHFELENFDTVNKYFELYQVFMYDFLCQNVPIFPMYILFTKITETFWSRDVTDIWVLAHFELKSYK